MRAVFAIGILVDRRLVLALATVPVPFEYLLRPVFCSLVNAFRICFRDWPHTLCVENGQKDWAASGRLERFYRALEAIRQAEFSQFFDRCSIYNSESK